MAGFDWSKLTYQQLVDLAKQQTPEIASGFRPANLDSGGSEALNNAKIDLSSLGLPGTASVTATPDQGLVFSAPSPDGGGHKVALRQGAGGGVKPELFNSGDSFLDQMIPIMLAVGAGAVGLNALGVLGEAVGTAASAPVSSVAGAGAEAAAAVPVGDLGIGAAGGSIGGESAGAAGGLFGDGGGLLGQGVTAATSAAPASSVAGVGAEAAATVPVGNLGIGTAGEGSLSLGGAGAGAAGGGGGGGGLSVGGDQLANEAAKLTAQNAAPPGSLMQTGLPSVNTTGGGNILNSLTGNPLSSLSNVAGSILQGNTAGNVAGTLAGTSTAAANTLAGAATQAGALNAGAATQAAGTLAGAATGAGKTLSDAYLQGGGNLAASQTAAGGRLSDADLKAAGILSDAYGTASAQQVASIREAMAANDKTLSDQRVIQQPYQQAGTDALTQLTEGLKAGGQYNKPFTMADAQNMDAYRFALDQGKQAINNAAGAGGLQLSSANIESLGKFAEGNAAQYEQQAFNQWLAQNNLSMAGLQNLVATGQVSTGQLQTALAQHGISAQTLNQNIGNVQAAGTINAAQAQAQGVTGSAQALNAGNLGAAQTQYTSGLGSAGALASGQIGAGNATAAGQIGSAAATAGGITGAGNATAAGQVGAGNATAAGQAGQGNAWSSGLSSLASGLINSGAGNSIMSGIGSIFGV